jgi:hypothetical protein
MNGAGYPCSRCDRSKNATVHARFHTDYHEYEPPYQETKRKPLKPRSDEMQTFYEEDRIPLVIAVLERDEGRCKIEAPGCHRYADTVHEIKTRGRFGGIRAPGVNTMENCLAACAHCNRYVSEHSEWAEINGFLESLKGRNQ